MAKRLIREKVCKVWNPCPDVTKHEVEKVARVLTRDRKFGTESVFKISCTWSSGAEREVVTLHPGEMRPMLAFAARKFAKSYRHRGIVLVDEGAKDEELLHLELQGLTAAFEFFKANGSDALMKARMSGGFRDEEFERYREKYRAYHINQAKEEILWQRIKKVREALGDPVIEPERPDPASIEVEREDLEDLKAQLRDEIEFLRSQREGKDQKLSPGKQVKEETKGGTGKKDVGA